MSLKELLAELQRDYIKTFPDKLALLRKLWAEGNIEDLKTEYHKMKGTGRTYGVGEVTEIGEAMELLCELDPGLLPTALPLSLVCLDRVVSARVAGTVHSLDQDRDFGVLVEYAIACKKAG